MHALRFRNYRLYFVGQAISMIGTSAQQVALAWLVYRLTGSAVLLGVTAFVSQAPQLLIAPLAGVIVDRHDRRRVLLLVQWLLLTQALILAALTYTNLIAPWSIIVMSLILGLLNSFDAPARQSLATRLVDHQSALPSAIALNSVVFNIGRFVGPPAAGILLSATSEATCFLVNALSFLGLIQALLRIRVAPHVAPSRAQRGTFSEGLRYAASSHPVRTLLSVVGLHNLTVASYIVVMPAITAQVFRGNPQILGMLLGAAGLGSLAAAAFLSTRRSVLGMPRIGIIGSVGCAVALIAFSFVEQQTPALILLFIVGFGMTTTNISSNTLLQTLISDQYRGRVMSLYTASVFGMAAVGGLIIGLLADWLDASCALTVEGAAFLVAALVLVPQLNRVGRQIGAASEGIGSAIAR
ncbi:MFS transporter [Uliginosibacterium sp. H3]|uniref:MFS transporter n=1 Tax=Uliginosibacterium silvisoli TaxID=3114758 RepID=A0ABU6K3E2_9RHOO|nr:MFS transporter [Uliginosibacterium sp. H3]